MDAQPRLAGDEGDRMRRSIVESPLFLLPTRLVIGTRISPETESVDLRCEWVSDPDTAAEHNSAGF